MPQRAENRRGICAGKIRRLRGRQKLTNSYQGKPEKEYNEHQPSLSLRDISPKGRDEFGLCVRAKKSAQGKSHAYLVNL